MSGESDLWGTPASDLQSGITVKDGAIFGTLKYYDDEGATIVHDWGAGNFLCLKFNASDWTAYTSVKVGLVNSAGTGLVEIITDPDKSAMLKIANKNTQMVEIVATDGTYTRTQTYSLRNLVCETE